MSEKVAIIGYGWVGKSMAEMFPGSVIYDEPKILESGSFEQVDALRIMVNNCDVAFVCVPTPNNNKAELDTSIVEEVIDWCESDLIVIRSTVNPGTADRIKEKTGKHVVTQPEYLGETVGHPLLDQTDRPFMILGGDPEDRRRAIEVYQKAYNANIFIRQVTNLEAEVIKLSENRAILYKVAQCQELYDACQAANVDYYTIRDAVYGDDPRFSLWHTFVFPDQRGANSKCIPKDTYAWQAWAESVGANVDVLNSVHLRNMEWLASND